MPDAQGCLTVTNQMRGSQRCTQVIDCPLRHVLCGQTYRAAVRAASAAARP